MTDRQDSDREVLTSLPRSRPVRRSAKRGDRADAKSSGSPAPRRAPAAKPAQAEDAKQATARRAKRTSARTAKAPSTRAKEAPQAAGRARTASRRKVPPAGYAAPSPRNEGSPGAGTADLLSTAIQATAELAQIGLTVGRQTLQSMIDRLPKP